jgi:hypothetical protein
VTDLITDIADTADELTNPRQKKRVRAGVTTAKIEEIQRIYGVDHTEAALLALEQRPAPRLNHAPIVYYMRMDRLVKIGTTANIAARVGAIMPQGVLAVEFGGVRLERERHNEFWDSHSHLEWFWMRDRLWSHISALRDQAPTSLGATVDEWLAKHGVGGRELGEAGAVSE